MRKAGYLLILYLVISSACPGQSPNSGYHWKGWGPFFLSADFLRAAGLEDCMPFGFRLNSQSQVALLDSGRQSARIKTTDTTLLDTVTYFLEDSTVKALRLTMNGTNKKAATLLRTMLGKHFGQPDFSNRNETVYSDEDFLACLNTKENYLWIQSLDHQALLEQKIMEVNLRNYRDDGRFWLSLSEQESIGLEFYNQVTKENNVQLAFRLYYQGPGRFTFSSISFQLENNRRVDLAVTPVSAEGVQKVTRRFINREDALAVLRSRTVRITLAGPTSKSYPLPFYQRHSLKTALQFYRENVTNPLIQYNGW